MESTLEEIEFLALSPNRVEVLTRLAASRHTRNDLAATTGASQATLGRILNDFQERSWIKREAGGYVATATGQLVADGFTDLLDILEIEGKLRKIVPYLPTHAMDVDLRNLADATITTPSQTKPNAPIQRLLDLLRDADEVRVFSHAFNEQSLNVIQERAVNDGQTFTGVFSRNAISALADDSRLKRRLERLLDAENAEVRSHDEGIPIAVTIADDTTHILLRDVDGVLQASIDTTDEAICSWAQDTFFQYWNEATPLNHGEFEN